MFFLKSELSSLATLRTLSARKTSFISRPYQAEDLGKTGYKAVGGKPILIPRFHRFSYPGKIFGSSASWEKQWDLGTRMGKTVKLFRSSAECWPSVDNGKYSKGEPRWQGYHNKTLCKVQKSWNWKPNQEQALSLLLFSWLWLQRLWKSWQKSRNVEICRSSTETTRITSN